MTAETFKKLREDYIEHINEIVDITGGLFPHLTVFADNEEDQPSIVHIPIPDEIMANDQGKEEFVDSILPQIAEELNKTFTPYAVAWASECWMRTVDKNQEIKENWKDLPKKEIIFVSIEKTDNTEVLVYNMVREGVKVDKHGEIVDNVKIELSKDIQSPDGLAGKFSGLFKKFQKK